MFKLLSRTIYFRVAQKAIVDETQSNRLVNYLQMTDPIDAALQIFKLVAVDPHIAMVSLLISSHQKITSCRRNRHEKFSTFVLRFQCLAVNHFLPTNALSSSQIGEVLAITLFNNANLEEVILTNAKLQLISHAEAHKTEEQKGADCTESVPKEGLLNRKKLNDQL